MKRAKWLIVIFSLPVFAVIWISIVAFLHRKGHNVLIPVEKLQAAEKAWANFEYISTSNRDILVPAIQNLVSEHLEFNNEQTQATIQLIDDILVAYSVPDWNVFSKFRFPTRDYEISPEQAESIFKSCNDSSISISNSVEQYKHIWLQTFAVPLWQKIAFFNSSLTITNVSKIEGFSFDFPDFVSKNNQNWMEKGLACSFDYSTRMNEIFESRREIQFMRLCFLGNLQIGNLNEGRPFMFVFFWDPAAERWLPWRFENAFIRKPIHTIRFF